MIITTINNNRLFIQFDSLINNGLILLSDGNEILQSIKVHNSEFEVMDVSSLTGELNLQIEIGEDITHKTINIK